MTRRVVSRYAATRCCYMGHKEVAWQGVPPPFKLRSQPSQTLGLSKVLSPGTAEGEKKSSALTHAMLCYVIVVVVELALIAG